MFSNWKVILVVPILFFAISLLTISDYGINWDEPIHFFRGQAYLHYFLTGEQTYQDLRSSRSFFQNDQLNAEYWINNDSGHPPINGILSAAFNLIFYQRLGILGDIEAHHLFNITVSSLLVFVVSIFAYQYFGFLASLVSSITLASYPLFFSESHFNIKDPPEAAFFGICIWAFVVSVKKWSPKWLFLSSIAFALGLGTKFNIIFLPLIIIPFLVLRFHSFKKLKKIPKGYLLTLLLSLPIIILIFVGSWPFLWQNPIDNFLRITSYYQEIGTGFNYQTSNFYFMGINIYAPFWIIITSSPWVLILTAIGIYTALRKFKEKDNITVLWLLWFAVPIVRVMLPQTSVYGGVRQITEYIPAMALLSGLGAYQLHRWMEILLKKFKVAINPILTSLILVAAFTPHIFIMIKLHPNQNVYFNSLIGGISGAKEKQIPSWGNSFGNAYYQAVLWLNQNAEKGARLALIQGTSLNIPKIMLREDIIFNNISWSGINRDGEYLLELTHQGSVIAYPFAWEYVENFLEPIYEVKVDGVVIAKLWKNDLAHTKPEYKRDEIEYDGKIEYQRDKSILTLKFDRAVELTRLRLKYQDSDCTKVSGNIQTSNDLINFIQEQDPYPTEFVTEKEKVTNTIYYYFNAKQVRGIKMIEQSEKSCLFRNPQAEIIILSPK